MDIFTGFGRLSLVWKLGCCAFTSSLPGRTSPLRVSNPDEALGGRPPPGDESGCRATSLAGDPPPLRNLVTSQRLIREYERKTKQWPFVWDHMLWYLGMLDVCGVPYRGEPRGALPQWWLCYVFLFGCVLWSVWVVCWSVLGTSRLRWPSKDVAFLGWDNPSRGPHAVMTPPTSAWTRFNT